MSYNRRNYRKPSKAYQAGVASAAVGIGCIGVLLILVLSILFTAGLAALLAVPLWLVWNNIVVPAAGSAQISLSQAPYALVFGLTFIVIFIANLFSRGSK